MRQTSSGQHYRRIALGARSGQVRSAGTANDAIALCKAIAELFDYPDQLNSMDRLEGRDLISGSCGLAQLTETTRF